MGKSIKMFGKRPYHKTFATCMEKYIMTKKKVTIDDCWALIAETQKNIEQSLDRTEAMENG